MAFSQLSTAVLNCFSARRPDVRAAAEAGGATTETDLRAFYDRWWANNYGNRPGYSLEEYLADIGCPAALGEGSSGFSVEAVRGWIMANKALAAGIAVGLWFMLGRRR